MSLLRRVPSFLSSRARVRASTLGFGLSLFSASGCQYDLDKLFVADEGAGPDAGSTALPADLIDLWKEGDVSDECSACAKDKCADENSECRDDAECVALTRCVAKSTDPATTNDCRAQHVPWLLESVGARDTGGPYQQCVFLNKCVAECDARNQIACQGNFGWPQTSESNVTLRLLFVDGLSGEAPKGLKVRACQAEVPETCRSVADWTDADATGAVSIDVPISLGSFQGYLELQGGDLYPTLLRFGWPIARDMVTGVTVVNDFSARSLVNMSPVKVDADRGLLQLRSFGCGGVPLRGVNFTADNADATTSDWYTVGQEIVPRFDIMETGDRGAGGIVNVKAGRPTITATRMGETIASVTAPVRAGFMTIVVMPPGDQ